MERRVPACVGARGERNPARRPVAPTGGIRFAFRGVVTSAIPAGTDADLADVARRGADVPPRPSRRRVGRTGATDRRRRWQWSSTVADAARILPGAAGGTSQGQ